MVVVRHPATPGLLYVIRPEGQLRHGKWYGIVQQWYGRGGGSSQRSLSAHLFLEIIPFAISCPYHCYHEEAGLFGPACLP